jgi:circadian clock protein KaiC
MRETVSTGVPGLDNILSGGLTSNRLYLVQGRPGAGKTTLALQFLMDGVAAGESVLYVTLSETEQELLAVADSHGWSLDGVHIHELVPGENDLDPDEQNTMFHPSEIEFAATTRRVLADVERLKPTRVVFDSLSEMRLLAGTALRYRRQILALKQYFTTRDCTVLLLDDMTSADHDMQSIVHGVLMLEPLNPEYGAERRRLRVVKFRGVNYRSGHHDYKIIKGGVEAFPRLVAAEHRRFASRRKMASGIEEFDSLIGGGLEEGTSTLIVGAAGTGKSTLAAQFVAAAASRGERSAMFIFDESPQSLLTRCEGLHIGLAAHCESGVVALHPVDPAELAPGELTHRIRRAVEDDDVRMVVIDSLNGYLSAMPEENFLIVQLHELLMYLGQKGVATILIGAHSGLIGAQMNTPIDASYLADAVILMRYYEVRGEVRQAVSVMKKRGSSHERTIRGFRMDRGRIEVGEPLRQFRGILTGVPIYDASHPAGKTDQRE